MGLLGDYLKSQAFNKMFEQQQQDEFDKQRARIDQMNQASMMPGLQMSPLMNPMQQEFLQSMSSQTQQPKPGLDPFEQSQSGGGLIGSMLKIAMFGR
jgi:hypothetical protein